MKKTFATILSLLLLLMCGCTAPTPTQAPTGTSTPTATPIITPVPTPIPDPYVPSIEIPDPVQPYEFDANATNIYVDAVNGSDETGNGTESAPYRTIAYAKEMVRPLLADMQNDIVINLKAGTYVLDNTLEFTQEDNGRNGYSVIYRSCDSERALISGGTQITGWTLHDASKNIWSASAQGVISRNFFVNGIRADRASTEVAKLISDPTRGGLSTDASNIFPGLLEHIDGFTTTDTSYLNFENIQDMEMVFVWNWHEPRVPVTEIVDYNGCVLFKTTDLAYSILIGQRDHAYGANYTMMNSIYKIENAYELMDKEGEFYLNKHNNTIYYIPREGQDMTSADAVVGRLEHLITGTGDKNSPLENIRFDSIDFAYTEWNPAANEEGHIDIQVGFYKGSGEKHPTTYGIRPSAAIVFSYAHNFSVINCSIAHTGNSGLDFNTSTQNTTVAGNLVYDCGNNGIMLGGHDDNVDFKPKKSDIEKIRSINNLIIDNTLHHIGAVFSDAAAIVRGYTYDTMIAHNTITECSYTGISAGWGWGHGTVDMDGGRSFPYGLSPGNSILCNYIYHAPWYLADSGSIYTLGRQDNMLIAGNYIDGSNEQGIYLDNGSNSITVQHNVLENVVRNFVVRGQNNTVKENYISPAPYADGIQPEHGGIFDIDYTNCSESLRLSIIATAGTRVPKN